mmetsp:Transcript_9450/g.21322  ORF Transcript_9450/g.21322 Transcript_9450/m.21322 type:complete len:221 (+) Transcript_9450:762-1424(+)
MRPSSDLRRCPSPSLRSRARAHARSRSTLFPSTRGSPACAWAGRSSPKSLRFRMDLPWLLTSTGSCAPPSTAPPTSCRRGPLLAWTPTAWRRSARSLITTWRTRRCCARRWSTLVSRCTVAPTRLMYSSISKASRHGTCSQRFSRRRRWSPSPALASGPAAKVSCVSAHSPPANLASRRATVSVKRWRPRSRSERHVGCRFATPPTHSFSERPGSVLVSR